MPIQCWEAHITLEQVIYWSMSHATVKQEANRKQNKLQTAKEYEYQYKSETGFIANKVNTN